MAAVTLATLSREPGSELAYPGQLLAPAASKLRACKGCQRAKAACGNDDRPCARCVRLNVGLPRARPAAVGGSRLCGTSTARRFARDTSTFLAD